MVITSLLVVTKKDSKRRKVVIIETTWRLQTCPLLLLYDLFLFRLNFVYAGSSSVQFIHSMISTLSDRGHSIPEPVINNSQTLKFMSIRWVMPPGALRNDPPWREEGDPREQFSGG